MHILKINDERGQSQKWWFNFLWELRSDTINNECDLAAEFAKWNAELFTGKSEILPGDVCDSIAFQNERDMTLFLLRWS